MTTFAVGEHCCVRVEPIDGDALIVPARVYHRTHREAWVEIPDGECLAFNVWGYHTKTAIRARREAYFPQSRRWIQYGDRYTLVRRPFLDRVSRRVPDRAAQLADRAQRCIASMVRTKTRATGYMVTLPSMTTPGYAPVMHRNHPNKGIDPVPNHTTPQHQATPCINMHTNGR